MKRRNILTRLLTGAVSATMVAGMLPVSALAVTDDQVAADGTYTASADVVFNDTVYEKEEEGDWNPYGLDVSLTVSGGKFESIEVTPDDTYDSGNKSYLEKATIKTKGIVTKLVGQPATAETISNWDVVSDATCTSTAVKEAALAAIAKAEEAQEIYVTMNVPYELFMDAYNLNGAAVWDVGTEYDAVTTATTSKSMGTTGTAKGTYNDGTNILGVTIPVHVSAADFAKLDSTLTVNDNFYYTTLDAEPEYYSELTIGEDGSYSFSPIQTSDISTDYLYVDNADLNLQYGDYQIDVNGVYNSLKDVVADTDATYAIQTGEDEYIYDYTIYGAVLNATGTDGNDYSYGLTTLENLWYGTRFTYLQIAWSVPEGKQLKNHGGNLFYQFEGINGATLNSIDLITNLGVISVPCVTVTTAEDGTQTRTPGMKTTEYYSGDLSNFKYSISNDSKELVLENLPTDLEDVQVTLSGGLADKAGVEGGKVALADYPEAGTQYTLTISSSNYPDITRTLSTPITDELKAELTRWMNKGQDILNAGTEDATLTEHVGEAADVLANEAGEYYSYDAAELIGELTILVKPYYEKPSIGALLTESDLKILLYDAAVSDMENPVYALTYTTGEGKRKQTVTLAGGDLKDLTVALTNPAVSGTNYTLTVTSDNYQDASVAVSVKANTDTVYATMNVPYELFMDAYDLDGAAVWDVGAAFDAVTTATTGKSMGTTGTAKGTYNDGKINVLGVTIPVKATVEDLLAVEDGLTVNNDFYYVLLDETPAYYSELTVSDGVYSFSAIADSKINTEYLSVEDVSLTDNYGDYQVDVYGVYNSLKDVVADTDATYAIQTGEDEYIYDYTIYGAVLNATGTDGKDYSYGLTTLENLWYGTRFTYLQIAWSVPEGKQLKNHGGNLFRQFEGINGATLNSIDLITSLGVISVPCVTRADDDTVTPGLKTSEYYTGDLSSLEYSIDNGSEYLNIKGIPEDFEDVTITLSGGLAKNAQIDENDQVKLTAAPTAGVQYTLTISSSNIADITLTLSTPITDELIAELTKWMDKGQAILDEGTEDGTLVEHVGEAAEVIENEAGEFYSYDAAELIGELKILVKKYYPEASAAATLKGSVLTVALDEIELSALDNPAYTLTYSVRQGRNVVTYTLTSGTLDDLVVELDAEPAVGTEYTLTIESDNYQDIVTSVTAEAGAENDDDNDDNDDNNDNNDDVAVPDGLSDTKNADGNWYYYTDNKVNTGYTGLAKNKNGWFYVKNGKVDFTYTGFAVNSAGKWYVVKGGVKMNLNTVVQDKTGVLGTKGDWYYVVKNKVQTGYTGVTNYKNAKGWWYVKNGKVDFSATTVAKNNKGWWYVKNGKVDFGYTGFASNSAGDWYVEKGQVKFTAYSVIKDTTGALKKGTWFYVVKSKVVYTDTVAKNAKGWWRIEDGKVNFNYHGIASNSHGRWYIKNGKVDFTYTGTVKTAKGTYKVVNGKVQ